MADYQKIVRLRPEVRDFIRNRRWVHRGDIITYGPNVRCDTFSTDAMGFRHSTFKGETLSTRGCVQRPRYGLVLGPSNVYGFGLAGNENTMPSLLAERFDFPFANIGLPEGNSRNLFAILLAIIARSPKPPAVVLYLSGGDFTNFAYTSIVDAVFGSPNLKQMQMAIKERGGRPAAQKQLPALLAFSSLWIRALAQMCRSRKIPFILGDDTTFFEKRQPSDLDLECGLGKVSNAAQERQFAIHRNLGKHYFAGRESLATALKVPLAGPGKTNDIGFIDEFHYDRDGTRALCTDFAKAIEALL